jgi:hypothetical protein
MLIRGEEHKLVSKWSDFAELMRYYWIIGDKFLCLVILLGVMGLPTDAIALGQLRLQWLREGLLTCLYPRNMQSPFNFRDIPVARYPVLDLYYFTTCCFYTLPPPVS